MKLCDLLEATDFLNSRVTTGLSTWSLLHDVYQLLVYHKKELQLNTRYVIAVENCLVVRFRHCTPPN
jgi:hypothetical protein